MIQKLRYRKRILSKFPIHLFPIPIIKGNTRAHYFPIPFFLLFFIPQTATAQGPGNSLNLDGVDNHANMGDILNNVNFPFSVSAWIYWEGPLDGTNSEYGIIIGDDHPGRNILFIQTGVYAGYTLFVRGDGSLNMRIGDGGNVGPNARRDKWSPANVIPLNQWTHVAGVVRGLTDMDLYVNGIDVGGIYDGNGGNMDFSNNPFTIGRYRKDPSQGEVYFFEGDIDEVRVWNNERSEAEIRRDMCHTLQGNEMGLLGYWKMDADAGAILEDSGPNVLAGNLNGDPTTIRQISSAPIGDQSEQVYETNWNGIDLDLSLAGSEFSVDQIQGNLQGIHIYQVNAAPNHLTGTMAGEAPIIPYFGTFMATVNGQSFNGSYQVNLGYDPATLGTCEPEASLYNRDHNADATWEQLQANSTPAQLNFAPNTQRGEFLMTYIPCTDTPSCNWEGIEIALTDSIVCQGRTIDFSLFVPPTNTANNFLVSWEWDFGDGVQSDQLEVQHFYDTPGTYTATLELTNIDGCDTTLTQTISVEQDALPQVRISADTSICAGELVMLDVLPIGNSQAPLSVEWDTGDALVPFVEEILTQSKTYNVRISNGCQTLSEEVNVEVSPSIEFELASTPVSCQGGSDGAAQILLTGGTAPFQTDWNGPGNAQFTVDEWKVEEISAGFYEVNLSDSLGCSVPVTFQVVEPTDPLELNLLSVDPAFCGDSSGNISLSASGGNGMYQFAWNGEGPISDPQISGVAGGMYEVSVWDSKGCQDSLNVSVPQIEAPSLAVKTVPRLDEEIPFEEVEDIGIQFVALSPDATRIEWDLGDSTTVELGDFVHLYREPGTYEIRVRAYAGQNSCFSEERFTVSLVPTENLFLPTAFSPNGDGINDIYLPRSSGTISTKMSIYDQWGQLLIQQEDILAWDGILPNGSQAPEGVYLVKLEAAYRTHEHVQTATITLIR